MALCACVAYLNILNLDKHTARLNRRHYHISKKGSKPFRGRSPVHAAGLTGRKNLEKENEDKSCDMITSIYFILIIQKAEIQLTLNSTLSRFQREKVFCYRVVSVNFYRENPLITSFSLFCLQDKESMIQVLRAVDKANGYCFGDLEERNLQAMMSAAVGADFQFDSYPFLITMVTHCDSSGLKSNAKIYGRSQKFSFACNALRWLMLKVP